MAAAAVGHLEPLQMEALAVSHFLAVVVAEGVVLQQQDQPAALQEALFSVAVAEVEAQELFLVQEQVEDLAEVMALMVPL